MSFRLKLLAALALLAPVNPASARNIVIGNDDGLTANVKALYDALKAEGHDVIVAVPCQQGSGLGGAVRIMQPIASLSADCANGAAKAGDPGAGPMTRPGLGEDFFYVDGTPVMAMLYGLDILAPARWGKGPDLVLSGPNIGRNAGPIVVSSGTVSNVQYAMMRGIPAIALSAGMNSASKDDLINPLSGEIAKRSLELVDLLDTRTKRGPLLPAGAGLNVNFPDQPGGAHWKFARVGTFSDYDARFVADLPAAMGKAATGREPMPGLYFTISDKAPAAGQNGDEAAIARKDISVSVLQIAYDAPASRRAQAERLLGALTRR
ncbi:5'/3'-nucleotidase SurE [Sphingopyxis sp. MSC1_008]|uniref:5'/3'-nucleotidase SurE n=1 Tax=Sphingopyxis sp. MSC1_008 TaxID=2909265 RepID=UPI0020C0C616|nr:5'/3'-nucleotidase SurE [Sphingopyxis sp. MSC1_008]